jgi:polyisoprenoid-binding protein YceI
MRVWIAIAVLSLAACTSLQGAANQPPPFTSAAAAPAPAASAEQYPAAVDLPAGTYLLDPRHATVLFRIRHMDLAWFTARFDTKAGELTLDPADPTRSRLTASVDATSVNTGVPNRQNDRAFDRQIGNALGAGANPQISFTSTAIERTGRNSARVTGDLAMNGQTHPTTLDVTFDGAAIDPLRGGNQVLGFSAHGEIDRVEWGVNEWSSFTGDTVQIVIEAEFVKS